MCTYYTVWANICFYKVIISSKNENSKNLDIETKNWSPIIEANSYWNRQNSWVNCMKEKREVEDWFWGSGAKNGVFPSWRVSAGADRRQAFRFLIFYWLMGVSRGWRPSSLQNLILLLFLKLTGVMPLTDGHQLC